MLLPDELDVIMDSPLTDRREIRMVFLEIVVDTTAGKERETDKKRYDRSFIGMELVTGKTGEPKDFIGSQRLKMPDRIAGNTKAARRSCDIDPVRTKINDVTP